MDENINQPKFKFEELSKLDLIGASGYCDNICNNIFNGKLLSKFQWKWTGEFCTQLLVFDTIVLFVFEIVILNVERVMAQKQIWNGTFFHPHFVLFFHYFGFFAPFFVEYGKKSTWTHSAYYSTTLMLLDTSKKKTNITTTIINIIIVIRVFWNPFLWQNFLVQICFWFFISVSFKNKTQLLSLWEYVCVRLWLYECIKNYGIYHTNRPTQAYKLDVCVLYLKLIESS